MKPNYIARFSIWGYGKNPAINHVPTHKDLEQDLENNRKITKRLVKKINDIAARDPKFREETAFLREKIREAEKQRSKRRWGLLLFWLIIPLISLILDLIDYKLQTVEFYDDHVIIRDPFLNKKSRTFAFHGIFKAEADQTFWKRLLNYGDVVADLPGETREFYTDHMINPEGLANHLNTKIIARTNVHTIVTE